MPEVRVTLTNEAHALLKERLAQHQPKTTISGFVQWCVLKELGWFKVDAVEEELVEWLPIHAPGGDIECEPALEPHSGVVYHRKLCPSCGTVVRPTPSGGWRCVNPGGCGEAGDNDDSLEDVTLTELPAGFR